jgi:predicted PurR-regulated permease PerM
MMKAMLDELLGLLVMSASGESSRRSKPLRTAVSVSALLLLVAATLCGLVWGWSGAVLAVIVVLLAVFVVNRRNRTDSHSPRG